MDSQRRPLGTVNTTSGDRGYGPKSGFTLTQTVDVLLSMVSTSLGSGDTGQLRDDLTRLCGVFGCAESLYKLAMVAFGMPNGQDIPKEASLECVTWKDVFQKACVEDKKLRERDGWMRNGLLHRLKDFNKFQLHTAARRLGENASLTESYPTLAWLVERRGGNAENARDPLTNDNFGQAVRSVRWSDAPYTHNQYGPIAEWDVADVTRMDLAFFGATRFEGDLSHWDVSNVNNMYGMFKNSTSFNSDLSRWDVSSVNYMSNMFRDATSFNSDLSRWDVSIVKDMGGMFWAATSFNSDLSRWDVSDVKNMLYMFKGATNFNSDLSHWNVSNVKNMGHMFWGATSFNSDLSRWNVSDGVNTTAMFEGAEKYILTEKRKLGSLKSNPAKSVHGEPKNLFDPTQFPPLPNRLPKLPEL